jgi:hypothetical protein
MSDLEFLRLDIPKLSFDKNDYKLVLSYKLGSDYLQSKFKFDYYKFVELYNQAKGIPTDDDAFDKFWSFAWREMGASERALSVLIQVVKYYQLNPSFCKRIVHMKNKGKGHNRKIELLPKKGVIDKFKGISKARGCHGAHGKRIGVDGMSGIDFIPDENKINTILFLMNSCIEEGARNWSLQGYSEYRKLYSDLIRANGSSKSGYISKSKDRELLKEFSSKVASLQRK